MAYYRLYTMSPRNGHILCFIEFDAADDTAAMEQVRKHEGGNPLELWDHARKVARLEATDPVAIVTRWARSELQVNARSAG